MTSRTPVHGLAEATRTNTAATASSVAGQTSGWEATAPGNGGPVPAVGAQGSDITGDGLGGFVAPDLVAPDALVPPDALVAPDALVPPDALIAPDVRMGGRRIMLAPHNCFACGQLNVHGLRIELHVDAGRCWTELALAERFEGWEGIAHGGILCTLLDEVMAWALIDHDSWGVTARMAVDFKRPVRIGVPIRAEGWIVRARRRLLETAGRIVDPATGEELAAATATYVAASEEKKRELKARYRFEISGDEPAPGRAGAGT